MDFSPLSEIDIKEMLKVIGVSEIDDLFIDVPKEILNPRLKIGEGLSELETLRELQSLAKKNKNFEAIFCGAGIYKHYIPPVVNELIHRNEFYTAYTPYQAEISQGFLQAIFEYQTIICNLTGMEATNASVYDGATAVAEAFIMAKSITRKKKFVIIQPFNPEYIDVLESYSFTTEFDIEYASLDNIETVLNSNEIGAVVFQNPNYLGELQDVESLAKIIKQKLPKALVIYLSTESTSLGLLKRPGTLGVDIICGEGQSIGLPMNFGGPGLGFIATTKKYMRKLPGRIVGRTKELNGEREGFLLTLQAREQHIRREKALSNICSNEALCMLSILIYLISMGYSGLRTVAEINVKNAYYIQNKIKMIDGYRTYSKEPFYNEFLVECNKGIYEKISKSCINANFCPPIKLFDQVLKKISNGTLMKFNENKDYFLICNTETNSDESIEKFLKILEEVMK